MKYRHIDFIFNHIRFATDIRGAMLENKLTGEELAAISGVSAATISACASNNNPNPHIGTILAIANALELNAMNYIELAY